VGALAACTVAAVFISWHLLRPEVFSDDAFVHQYWMWQFRDAALFNDSLTADLRGSSRYPVGYQALFGLAMLTRAGGVDVPSRATRRPELPARDAWSGFVVTLHPADLERAASRGRSELCISVRTRGIRRRRTRFAVSGPGVLRTHVVETQSGAFVEVTTGGDGSVRIRPRHSHARLRAYRLDQGDDAELMLTGDVRLPARTFPALEVRRASDDFAVAVPMWVDDARKTFRAWLSVGELEAAAASAERVAGGPETLEKWTLRMAHDGVHLPVEFPEELPRQVYSRGSLMLSLQAGPTGEAVIVETLAARVPAVVGPTAVQAAP